MTTKATVLAAARRRWGKRAFVRENRNAMTGEQRLAHIAKYRAMKDEIDALDAKAKACGDVWQPLLQATEFFIAVNGDEPSGTQLREAAAKAREFHDTNELRKATRREWESGRSLGYFHRWEAGYLHDSQLGDISSTHAHGDTLDDLLQAIEPVPADA